MNDNNNNKLRMIVQAGAVGICVLMVFLLAYQMRLNSEKDKQIMNHLSESTEAIRENTKVQQNLINVVEDLDDYLKELK